MQPFHQSLLTLLKNKTLHVCLIGGLVFISIFYISYLGIDSDLYQARDDGVITMSHAKNWVEHGFIGAVLANAVFHLR